MSGLPRQHMSGLSRQHIKCKILIVRFPTHSRDLDELLSGNDSYGRRATFIFYSLPEAPEPSKTLPRARTSIFPKSWPIPSHGDLTHPKYDHFGHVRMLPRTIYFQKTDPYDPPPYLVNYSPSNFGDPSRLLRKALVYRHFYNFVLDSNTMGELVDP